MLNPQVLGNIESPRWCGGACSVRIYTERGALGQSPTTNTPMPFEMAKKRDMSPIRRHCPIVFSVISRLILQRRK